MSAVTNPLTYNLWVTQIADLAVMQIETVAGVVQGVDASFNQLLPSCLNYAELRIQRDLDLLPSQTTRTYALVSGNNVLTTSVDDFVTIQTINITNTVSQPLLPVSKEFINSVFGFGSTSGPPTYFAMLGGDLATSGNTSNIILLGPTPDSNYPVAVVGTIRLPSLYYNATTMLAGTATTFISSYLPDLLTQASMIYISQFQRNFGPSMGGTNDPGMPGSFESQYENLLRGAQAEEGRKKFAASGWSSMSQPVVATPSR